MKLFFRHFGTGQPVIILHGLFGLSDNWVTFGRQLGEHYSVYIPDLRNHGQSPHSKVFDFPSLENDLNELFYGNAPQELKEGLVLEFAVGTSEMYKRRHLQEILAQEISATIDGPVTLIGTIENRETLETLK